MNRFLILSLALGLVAAGCDDDKKPKPDDNAGPDANVDAPASDGGDGGGKTDVNVSTEKSISKADGGSITLKDAVLEIPADSMETDEASVTITMSAKTPPGDLPDQGSLATLYFEFGPEGLEFNPPALLKIPAPEDLGGKVPVISYFNDETSQWEVLATSVEDGFLVAAISHFSGYAGRAVDASACAFEACGGDISGFWEVDSFCAEADVNTDNPYGQACQGAEFTKVDEINDGYLSFYGEGQETGFSLNLTGTATLTGTVPTNCLGSLQAETCGGLEGNLEETYAMESVTCTASGGNCSCTGTGSGEGFSTSGPYTASGNHVALELGGEAGTQVFGVCVHTDGTKLEMGNAERVIKMTKNDTPT